MTLRIYCDKDSSNARAIMSQMEIVWADKPEQADVLWMRHGYRKYYGQLQSNQCLNHIPSESVMTNKGHLTHHLRKMPDSSQFYKEAYRLYVKSGQSRFIEALEHDAEQGRQDIWILKPAILSKGRGMRIFDSTQQLVDYFTKGVVTALIEQTLLRNKYIIQRYISDVLLLNQRKSEFRVYFLIKQLEPFEAYLFDEGVVRLCVTPFKNTDYDNASMHLTNIYQQKRHKDFNPNFRLKWTFLELQTYLNKQGYTDNKHYIHAVLMQRVANALRCVIESVKPLLQLQQHPSARYFGVYGADFILDDALNPWLSEVQVGPGLAFNDPIKKHVIFDMLQEAIAVVSGLAKPQRFQII